MLIDFDKFVRKIENNFDMQDTLYDVMPCHIIDMAKECEAVDAVPVVHGHWKAYPECGATRCSVCDWSIEEAWWSNYCPLCGAKMDDGGVQEDAYK